MNLFGKVNADAIKHDFLNMKKANSDMVFKKSSQYNFDFEAGVPMSNKHELLIQNSRDVSIISMNDMVPPQKLQNRPNKEDS
jgi:hypothetical protein